MQPGMEKCAVELNLMRVSRMDNEVRMRGKWQLGSLCKVKVK